VSWINNYAIRGLTRIYLTRIYEFTEDIVDNDSDIRAMIREIRVLQQQLRSFAWVMVSLLFLILGAIAIPGWAPIFFSFAVVILVVLLLQKFRSPGEMSGGDTPKVDEEK
jgi:hypothetical protein